MSRRRQNYGIKAEDWGKCGYIQVRERLKGATPQSHLWTKFGWQPMEEKGGKQSSPFPPWSLWMPVPEAPPHIGRWLPKHCSELTSVPCGNFITGRFRTQESTPNFVSSVIPPGPPHQSLPLCSIFLKHSDKLYGLLSWTPHPFQLLSRIPAPLHNKAQQNASQYSVTTFLFVLNIFVHFQLHK